jgi:hypothetical protein
VAEAGQGALHRPGRAANVWERLGWPQLGRPAIPPRPAATRLQPVGPTAGHHRIEVAHGLPLPGHRQHKRRPTHRNQETSDRPDHCRHQAVKVRHGCGSRTWTARRLLLTRGRRWLERASGW